MEIRPFRGWRFRVDENGDVSKLIAPPYDVLKQADKDALLGADGRNIVCVDLPHVPPSEAGADEVYINAAKQLEEWKNSGVLFQDTHPVLYVYEQAYRWAGKRYVRRSLLCGLRATPLGEDVIAHEHTFAGPKKDRLKLTQQTRMQMSPIFGFYRDPEGSVADLLAGATDSKPHVVATLDGVEQRLWVISGEGTIARIQSALKNEDAFIADGHHRYTTALNYRDTLEKDGKISPDHEANFVMFALVSRDDPGLLVLPTHRMVSGLKDGFSVEKLQKRCEYFNWSRISVESANLSDADSFLRKYGPGAMAFMDSDLAEIWIARLNDPSKMLSAAPDLSDEWRSLGVSILHKLIIDDALTPWRTDDLSVEYTPDGQQVLDSCRSGRSQFGACLQSTPVNAVESIAKNAETMPHKSTYFFPKIATGMVLKPLE